MQASCRSACIEIKECEKIFTELIRSIEKIHTEVIELIGANEKAAVNQAEGRMKKLEQEIAELRRRNAELKQLSETEDHIHFLQNFQSLCAPPEAGDLPSVTVNTDISFGAVRKAVSELKDHIEDFYNGELVKITKTGGSRVAHLVKVLHVECRMRPIAWTSPVRVQAIPLPTVDRSSHATVHN
ncbi:UNVERIFIED_CONTAM: hypothetical protein FKN15_041312 [Acipenser sinensis]